jgi:hypothetical protein
VKKYTVVLEIDIHPSSRCWLVVIVEARNSDEAERLAIEEAQSSTDWMGNCPKIRIKEIT